MFIFGWLITCGLCFTRCFCCWHPRKRWGKCHYDPTNAIDESGFIWVPFSATLSDAHPNNRIIPNSSTRQCLKRASLKIPGKAKKMDEEQGQKDGHENGTIRCPLLTLDVSIVHLIFWHMPDLPSLLNFTLACKRLFGFARDESFWRQFLVASLKGETRMV